MLEKSSLYTLIQQKMPKHPEKLPKEKFALVNKIIHLQKNLYISCQKNYTFLPTIY